MCFQLPYTLCYLADIMVCKNVDNVVFGGGGGGQIIWDRLLHFILDTIAIYMKHLKSHRDSSILTAMEHYVTLIFLIWKGKSFFH